MLDNNLNRLFVAPANHLLIPSHSIGCFLRLAVFLRLSLAVFSASFGPLFFFFCQLFGTWRRGWRQRELGSTSLGNPYSRRITGNAFQVLKQAFIVVAWPEPAGKRRPRYQYHGKTENLLHDDFLGCNTRASITPAPTEPPGSADWKCRRRKNGIHIRIY